MILVEIAAIIIIAFFGGMLWGYYKEKYKQNE